MTSSSFHTREFFSSIALLESGSLNRKKEADKVPKVVPSAHEIFACASSSLRPQYSDNKGRYFTAKADITVGDM